MKILGVDYGRKKIGLAIATTVLAEVYGVAKTETVGESIAKIKNIIKKEGVEKVVVGLSEGEMAKETKEFAKLLKQIVKVPIVFQDETLSTRQAQSLSISANVRRKKRKSMEDAYAAALILQSYLDTK